MRRAAKVNDLENCGAIFSSLSLGALRGVSPAEGGSGKAVGFGAWGETSPKFTYIELDIINSKCFLLYNVILYFQVDK
jgi:hypothetical protein